MTPIHLIVDEMYQYTDLLDGEEDFLPFYKRAEADLEAKVWRTNSGRYVIDDLTTKQLLHIHFLLCCSELKIYFRTEWMEIIENRFKEIWEQ